MAGAGAPVQSRTSPAGPQLAFPPARTYTGPVKGPPITVRCDCGKKALVAYGAVWQCDDCSRRWNTNQIASEDYWSIMREMRRFRFKAIQSMLVLGAVFVGLAVTLSTSFLILIPLMMSAWYLFYMPRWRKRVRRHARGLPKWDLHPE